MLFAREEHGAVPTHRPAQHADGVDPQPEPAQHRNELLGDHS